MGYIGAGTTLYELKRERSYCDVGSRYPGSDFPLIFGRNSGVTQHLIHVRWPAQLRVPNPS